MALQLKLNMAQDTVGPETVSGSNHTNPFGMRFITYRNNVKLKSCIINGDAGSYTIKLYKIVDTVPVFISGVTATIETTNADTPVTLDLTAPEAAEYYVGFDATHGNLKRSDDMAFPFEITGVISVTTGVQYNLWSNTFSRWYYFFNLQIEYPTYSASGNAILGPYSLPTVSGFRASAISWDETIPDDTTLAVYAGIADTGETPTAWQECSGGASIPALASGKDLYVKVTASTANSKITPTLENLALWYEGNDNHSALRIRLTEVGRLRYPQGEIAINYTATAGNLKNEAGTIGLSNIAASASVDEEDIVLMFNPNANENLLIGAVDLTVSAAQVEYAYRESGDEQISISNVDLGVAVYDTNDNPV